MLKIILILIFIFVVYSIFVLFIFSGNKIKDNKKKDNKKKDKQSLNNNNKIKKKETFNKSFFEDIKDDKQVNIQEHKKILDPLKYKQKDSNILNITLSIKNQFKLKVDNDDLYNIVEYYFQNYPFDYMNCLFFIFINFKDINQLDKLNLGEYIIWKSNNQQNIDIVYKEIIILSKNNNTKISSIAIDILLRSNNIYYINIAKQLLNNLREKERTQIAYRNIKEVKNVIAERKEQIIPREQIFTEQDYELQLALFADINRLENIQRNLFENNNKKSTIYNDTQNVHNHEINEKVLNTAINLSETINKNIDIDVESEIEKLYPGYKEPTIKRKIKESIFRIQTDKAKFRGDITVSIIFNKISQYILNSQYKDELIIRLADELLDMHELCSTGMLSRLMNSIQSFPDTPDELKISINPKDEIYANIQTYLDLEIQNDSNSDQLIDDMISDNKEEQNRYYDFIANKMLIKCIILEKEYLPIIDKTMLYLNIEDSLNNYLKNQTGLNYIMTIIKNNKNIL